MKRELILRFLASVGLAFVFISLAAFMLIWYPDAINLAAPVLCKGQFEVEKTAFQNPDGRSGARMEAYCTDAAGLKTNITTRMYLGSFLIALGGLTILLFVIFSMIPRGEETGRPIRGNHIMSPEVEMRMAELVKVRGRDEAVKLFMALTGANITEANHAVDIIMQKYDL